MPEIWVAHNLDLDAEHLWLSAVDSDNVLHQSRDTSELECGHVLIRTACFPDLRLKPVKEYRLRTHLADRRFRFKPEATPPGAVPTDEIVWGPALEEDGRGHNFGCVPHSHEKGANHRHRRSRQRNVCQNSANAA